MVNRVELVTLNVTSCKFCNVGYVAYRMISYYNVASLGICHFWTIDTYICLRVREV